MSKQSGKIVAAFTVSIVAAVGFAAPAQAAEGTISLATNGQAVPGSYVVVFKDGHAPKYRGTVTETYDSALTGYAATLSDREARRLAADPAVAAVYQNQIFSVEATQANPPNWGLDRIDQRNLPLNKSYTYPDSAGAGVSIYVVDTGVRVSHQDFGGRAKNGLDAVDNDNVAQDGHGHGTHVAGIAAGKNHGVAKAATVVAVRVLDNNGSGTLADVVEGIDWVTKDAKGKKAVANLSLGGGVSTAIDTAVRNSIKSGVTYVVAAGNANQNASGTSPARVSEAITVAASDSADKRASFSNYGAGIDLFAPGVSITSAFKNSDTETHVYSGTSQATPHVAGAAALYLSTKAGTPAQVRDALVSQATKGKITDPKGSPNNLLYVGK